MLNLEKILSALGAFIAILALASLTKLGNQNYSLNIMLIASMGASTFLIFVTPHNPMAQPWPVIGGHLVSAFIGVACAHWLYNPTIAVASAISLSILAMHILKCPHPPSASTALIAALAGREVSWQFCYEVIMFNALTITLMGLIINRYLLRKRYPIMNANHTHHQEIASKQHVLKLSEKNFKWAIAQMDGIIDVTEEDLVDLYEFAIEHAMNSKSKK